MNNQDHNIEEPSTPKEFKGFNMEELRHQKALLLVKKEFMKQKVFNDVDVIKSRIPIINGKNPLDASSKGGMMGKILKGLNYADYLMLGFSAFKLGRKVFSFFRK